MPVVFQNVVPPGPPVASVAVANPMIQQNAIATNALQSPALRSQQSCTISEKTRYAEELGQYLKARKIAYLIFRVSNKTEKRAGRKA